MIGGDEEIFTRMKIGFGTGDTLPCRANYLSADVGLRVVGIGDICQEQLSRICTVSSLQVVIIVPRAYIHGKLYR